MLQFNSFDCENNNGSNDMGIQNRIIYHIIIANEIHTFILTEPIWRNLSSDSMKFKNRQINRILQTNQTKVANQKRFMFYIISCQNDSYKYMSTMIEQVLY